MNNTNQTILLEKYLLADYQPGDFFLASPSNTVLGKGVFAQVPRDHTNDNQLKGLANRISDTLINAKLAGHSKPIVVGAVPFDYQNSAQLIIPKHVEISESENIPVENEAPSAPEVSYRIKSVPSLEQYKQGVAKGIAQIKDGNLQKIVLSRSLHLTASQQVNVPALLSSLAQHNHQGYTFAVNLKDEGHQDSHHSPERTLIGASPELLVSKAGPKIVANPLAGSRPRSADPVEDERRAAELLASEKDLHEHAVVVQAVAEALKPYCKTLEVPSQPSIMHTETMWHLSTEIRGEIVNSSTSSFQLASALHPTPAVCGTPTEAARESIYEIEPFDRAFFTGMVGWCDENGDGEWIVTIRCAEIEDCSIKLFAGAGVVGASKPEEELAETSAKFRTVLKAMGIEEERFISNVEE